MKQRFEFGNCAAHQKTYCCLSHSRTNSKRICFILAAVRVLIINANLQIIVYGNMNNSSQRFLITTISKLRNELEFNHTNRNRPLTNNIILMCAIHNIHDHGQSDSLPWTFSNTKRQLAASNIHMLSVTSRTMDRHYHGPSLTKDHWPPVTINI